jgi:hypothetical protein
MFTRRPPLNRQHRVNDEGDERNWSHQSGVIPRSRRDTKVVITAYYQPEPKTNPIERSIGLNAVPKDGDVMLFWISRSAADPKAL